MTRLEVLARKHKIESDIQELRSTINIQTLNTLSRDKILIYTHDQKIANKLQSILSHQLFNTIILTDEEEYLQEYEKNSVSICLFICNDLEIVYRMVENIKRMDYVMIIVDDDNVYQELRNTKTRSNGIVLKKSDCSPTCLKKHILDACKYGKNNKMNQKLLRKLNIEEALLESMYKEELVC